MEKSIIVPGRWCCGYTFWWRRGVVVITTAQVPSTKPELGFCAGSNPVLGVLEIRDGENLWQWFRLGIKLNAFRRSTIPQKQFNSIHVNLSKLNIWSALTLRVIKTISKRYRVWNVIQRKDFELFLQSVIWAVIKNGQSKHWQRASFKSQN